MWLRPPRSPTIVGSAVDTIVWSSAAINRTSIRPANTTITPPVCRWESAPPLGAPGAPAPTCDPGASAVIARVKWYGAA
jgi:hypothetical protein